VGFESWLERDHVMLLDFDPAVVGIASQPFWLFWVTAEGKARSHAPDYFVRRRDGSGVVVDCRPVDRRRPRDVVAFEATEQACEAVGWDYRLVGSADEVLVRNVRWISGSRHPRHHDEAITGRLLEAFTDGAPLLAGAREVGDPGRRPGRRPVHRRLAAADVYTQDHAFTMVESLRIDKGILGPFSTHP
jgi:hypothetical protein